MAVRRAILIGGLLLIPALALAQRTTTGTVAGRIVDSNGGVLPGVTVTLKSPEALGEFTGVTNGEGIYRIQNLPPATYEVKAELQGFQTIIRHETVRLGAVTQVDVTLSVGSVSETVTVQGESPIVDPERAGLSVNVNNTALTSLPMTTNRRFQDIWLMVPGVYVRPDTQEPGNLGSERRTSVDGMDVTDPYGGDIFAVNLNYEAIQDVEIKALGAEASDGASMIGQFMNVVTKSGGNDLHGSFAFFAIPQRFNDSNVAGIAPNRRKELQPDSTLGGPILRDRLWFFGSYRRIQQDQTVNNAPVPRERRGNLYFVKVTGQMDPNHRLSGTFQYDRTRQQSAVIRGAIDPGQRGVANTSSGLSSATMQQTNPSGFGTRITGGPMVGANYNWVMSNTRVLQFVASWMISKPSNAEPNDGAAFAPTKVIQTNAAGNIAGSLTTIAQEGSFGAIDNADRSMLYLAPSMTFFVNRMGSHEFRGGADLYPFIRNVTSSEVQPVEYYFRPPGTTGNADVLFERRTLRNFAGTGATVANEAYERHYAGYFQDRWKPSASISIKAGVRIETNTIYTKDREKVLGPRLPANIPTNTSDREFHQTVGMPNVGIAWDAGKYGVFRATANRSYEWLDLGGGDGTSNAPYVLTTDVVRANPRGGPLNEVLPGQFALGVRYGDEKDGSIHNGRTYNNEFSGTWEHRLPATSSFSTTFLWRRFWDYQSGDDHNIIRNPVTGAFLGRPFPDFDVIRNIYNPNYTWQQNKSIQFMYTKNFSGAWGLSSSYWYQISSRFRTRWNPTSDTLQFLGFSPADDETNWTLPRHHARLATYVRLPFGTMFSVFYSYTQGRRFDITTGDFPLNATAPRIVLSNGRAVSDPFFNPSYPRARKRDVDMLASDNSNLVNLRIQKSFDFAHGRRIEVSGDVFNLFNSATSYGFLSTDARSANFGRRDNYVQPRVGQVGARIVF
ncbi:MAG: TonB-dependent receptor [Acidobacteria bacterium]|nr:TonB-dependent receptor [Acidobacteriota bacterium]